MYTSPQIGWFNYPSKIPMILCHPRFDDPCVQWHKVYSGSGAHDEGVSFSSPTA